MPRRVLPGISGRGRHAVHWNDHLESSQGGAGTRIKNRAFGRGSHDYHGLDALLLQDLFQVRVTVFFLSVLEVFL